MPALSTPVDRQRPTPRNVLVCALLAALILTIGPTASPVADAASVTAAAAPPVIPALTDWRPGTGSYKFDKHSRILTPTNQPGLLRTAATLAEEVEAIYGEAVTVLAGRTPPRSGDIVLHVDADRTDLADEGYEMAVGDVVQITGATDDGAFYGSRTLLQLLSQNRRIPQGRTHDVPRYPERGLTLGGATHIRLSLPWIERLMRDMAYTKLNYLTIALKVKSEQHPETNQWSYYTKDEARQIAKWAEKYHITLIPWINAPGHMEKFLYDRPDLQLTDKHGNKSVSRLDITKPEAFGFYTELVDEYDQIFDSPYWMLGADEYMWGTSFDNYPQIGEYARRTFGPDAVPVDAVLDFINRVDDHVNGKGMALRIWNDGIPSSSTVALNSDIIIEHWEANEVKPSEHFDAGHTVMNAASALYHNRGVRVSPTSLCGDRPVRETTLQGCVPLLWEDGWHPGRFEDEEIDPGRSGLRGAHLSLWAGPNHAAMTEHTVERNIFMPLRFIAQRTWGSIEPFVGYNTFTNRALAVGRAPGWHNANYRTLRDGTYSIRPAAGAGVVAPRQPAQGSELIAAGTRRAQWQLHQTDDGHYRIVSGSTGLCVDMRRGWHHAGAPMEVGAAATLESCSASATQQWEITRSSRDSGFTVTHAISRMVMDIAADGTLVQRPPDQASDSRWRIEPEGFGTVDVKAEAELLEPGRANQVSATFTNHGQDPVTDLGFALEAPQDWQVETSSEPAVGPVPPGESRTTTFAVTPPADASHEEDYILTARATYARGATAGKRETASGSLIVHTDPITCPEPPAVPVQPSDEFGGDRLDGCRWTTVLDPDLSAMRVEDGQLKIETGDDDLTGPGGTLPNLVLQRAPVEDWVIETKMTAPLHHRYQHAGVMAYGDDDNYVKFYVVADNPAGSPPDLRVGLTSEQDGVFRKGGEVNVFNPTQNPDDTWWLRLTGNGATYTAAYSVDGEVWIDMPGAVSNPAADSKVGLFAAGPPQGSPPAATVAFDYFHLSTDD